MASKTGAIRAGRAFVELYADDSALRRTLAGVSTRLKAWGAGFAKLGAGMAGIGTSILAPLTAAASLFSDAGSALADMSARTGIGVEALSELKYAVEQSAGSMELLEVGVKSMQKMLAAAGEGSKGAVDTLSALGMVASDLAGLSPDEQFTKLADALSTIGDPGQRAALAMKAFGKSGQQLLPLFAGGAEGLRAMRAEAVSLGLVMSTKDATAAEAFGDAIDRLKAQLQQFVVTIGSAVAPALMDVLKYTQGAGKAAIDWASQNKPLIATAFAVGVAITAAGTAFIGIGAVLAMAGAAFSGLAAAIGMAGSALTFLMTPLGAGLGILAAAGASLGYLAVTSLDWAAALSTVKGAWSAVSAAIESGDMETAAEIAFQAVRVAWKSLIVDMKSDWKSFEDGLAQGLAGSMEGRLFALASGVDHDRLMANLLETQAMTGPRAELEAERRKLESLIQSAKSIHPGDLPASAGIPFAANGLRIPATLPAAAASVATSRVRMEGTTSALSDRMFGGGADKDQGASLKTIAKNTAATAAAVDRLSRRGVVYRMN
jgi:hypothetical protein